MPSNFPHFSNNGCELGDLLDYKPEMKSWCYHVLPLTYDDSLSYYEVLCKNIAMISKALSKDMPEMMNTINCMQNFIQAMSSHLNEFIDDYNSNVNRIDGELSRIETKFDGEVTRLDNKIDTETADIRAKYVKKAGDTMSGQLNMHKADVRWSGDNNRYVHISSEFNNTPLIKLSGETPTTTNGTLNITPTNISFLEARPGQLSGLDTPTSDTQAANKKYVDDKVAALGTVLEYKGTKANIAALPQTGNKAGDVWYVESEQSAYAWVIDTSNPQGHWEEFGPPINLEPYLKKDGSVPMTGNLDMGGHSVTNTAEPTNNTDVANKGYVDTKIGDINRFVLKSGDTMTGQLNMSGNKITNVGTPTSDTDSANKKYVDENGFQGIPVIRDEVYISKPHDILSTKVLADPTAPPEHPIRDGQVAVYSTTNQTYDPNDVTATLLVADPHSDMEAVNKRTIGQYLSKANIDDEFERVTTSKGLNPGTENYRVVSTNTTTMGEGRIPAMTPTECINVKGMSMQNIGGSTNQWFIGHLASTNRPNLPRVIINSELIQDNAEAQLILNKNDILQHTDEIPTLYLATKIHQTDNTIIENKIEMDNNVTLSSGTTNSDGRITAGYYMVLNNESTKPGLDIYRRYGNKINHVLHCDYVFTKINGGLFISDQDDSNQIKMTAASNYGEISFEGVNGRIKNLFDPNNDYDAANKHYVDTNFIKVEGTPQEGSTIAFKNGKWTVVDHTTWNPLE